MTLPELKTAADNARKAFESIVPRKFPGLDHWHWERACAAMRGENVRRNDDESQDAALAADAEIAAAYKAYIAAVHAYYSARDGASGFLGSRGL